MWPLVIAWQWYHLQAIDFVRMKIESLLQTYLIVDVCIKSKKMKICKMARCLQHEELGGCGSNSSCNGFRQPSTKYGDGCRKTSELGNRWWIQWWWRSTRTNFLLCCPSVLWVCYVILIPTVWLLWRKEDVNLSLGGHGSSMAVTNPAGGNSNYSHSSCCSHHDWGILKANLKMMKGWKPCYCATCLFSMPHLIGMCLWRNGSCCCEHRDHLANGICGIYWLYQCWIQNGKGPGLRHMS